ncbi:NADH-quinone oxidoreductase subunit C [Beijerinckiaceae bacterium RH AL1]|nr:NADH-quinone oxidoreductase subunit C [Beijerinckiaceae bacterium]VVB45271.1 NADH-quinone oxidoreductase subunit C [Beijerinckiaceae bacterium RH CH11]VVB45349.1 NADH-quinone oxidoreductase subunit C [Beijerinckiaceae bacterium RH AL8]VVC54781.1 NADH-quinone oxidoreductase subunit C [Beijerinckiaceae bacterium RH AL1]
MDLKGLGEHIAKSLPGAVLGQAIAYDQLTLMLDPARLVETATFLRDDPDCAFVCFIDTTAVDYPEREKRFDVVTHLLSPRHVQRIRFKVETDERTPVASLTGVWPGALWFEREVWDLFGVFFTGHPDMRRLLTDYGFDGHPLRKDFPMTGFVEVRWDDEQKRVVNEPVKLNQAYRSFDFLSPWEGAGRYVLPGDEKAGTQEGQR